MKAFKHKISIKFYHNVVYCTVRIKHGTGVQYYCIILYSNTGCNGYSSGNSYGYFIQIMVLFGFKLGSVFTEFYYTIYYIISYIMLLLIKVVKNKNNYF